MIWYTQKVSWRVLGISEKILHLLMGNIPGSPRVSFMGFGATMRRRRWAPKLWPSIWSAWRRRGCAGRPSAESRFGGVPLRGLGSPRAKRTAMLEYLISGCSLDVFSQSRFWGGLVTEHGELGELMSSGHALCALHCSLAGGAST